jgi:hypothetical protein
MSSRLTMEPKIREKVKLSYDLKSALRKRFGCVESKLFDKSDISYLKGLYDAGIEDAKIVIDYIQIFEEIILDEEF